MKKLLFLILTILTTLTATSCQDEEFGFTEQEVFQGAYKRNFEKTYGKIDPNQSWDFSRDASGSYQSAATRAMNADGIDLDTDGYYRVQKTTLDWVNNNIGSKPASSFVFKYNCESLTFIPIYIAASQTTNWQLKTRGFEPKGNNEECKKTDLTWWSRNNSQVQITNACTTCGGSGNVPATCGLCSGSGHVLSDVDCHECGGHGTIACSSCGGDGTWHVWFIVWFDLKCWICKGSGKFNCNRCNATGKVEEEITCGTCSGSGLSGTTSCHTCNGTGGTLNWAKETDTKGTSEAVATRAKPQKQNISGIGAGDIIYPYLYSETKSGWSTNKTYNTSIDKKIKFFAVPRPTNISSDKYTYVLACETGSDNDYKDIIFLVVSNKKFESVPTEPLFTSLRKRYLIEDLCSSSDFDFNDIVVDVEQIKAYNKSGNNGDYGFKLVTTQKATLKHVCGTKPFEVSIGGTTLFTVTDPTYGNPDILAEGGTDPEIEKDDLTTWNPETNNISVKVWKSSMPGAESYEGAEFVSSSFPETGDVPFIIATDVSVPWTAKDGERFEIGNLK